MYHRRPTLPRHNVTRDADVVSEFLKKWSPAKHLPFSQLTLKVILLWLSVSGQRSQASWMMDLRNMTRSRDDIRCRFGDLLKTTIPAHHQSEIVFGAFPADKSLCVVRYLHHYLKRARSLRGSETKLFTRWKDPYKALSRDTTRRWTKLGLQKVGIDMSTITPHSTTAAPSSKAAQKILLKTVLRTVGWRRASAFAVVVFCFFTTNRCGEGQRLGMLCCHDC